MAVEMEANGFLSFWQRLNVPATVVVATLIDRFEGDQLDTVNYTLEDIGSFSHRTVDLLSAYVEKRVLSEV